MKLLGQDFQVANPCSTSVWWHSRLARWVLSLGCLTALIGSASVAAASSNVTGYHGQPPRVVLQPQAKYLVLMVLDGARPDYFHLGNLPHLNALIKSGANYSQAIAGILESETPTGHATISTGSTPQRSGILGFSWAENDANYSLFSPTVVRAGAIEHIMQNAHVPTIAGLYKARFPNNLVTAVSGYKYYAVDPLGGPNADDILYLRGTLQKTFAPTAIPGHVPPAAVFNDPALTVPLATLKFGQDDAMATQLALDSFAVQRQHITLINYPDFDWPLGHVYGGIDARAAATHLMQVFDADLGRIEDAYARAGVLKQTLFVITADHGMAPIRRFIPSTVINNAVKAAGTTAPSVGRNTATYIWLHDPSKDAAVAANVMKTHDPGIQSAYYLAWNGKRYQYILSPGSIMVRGEDAANKFLLSTLLNGHQPEVVIFSRRGQTMSDSSTHWKADHGGNTWGVQHVPLIMAGPGIQAGVTITQPAQLEDIAPTALADLGVRPIGMQGHILTEALSNPYTGDLARRANEVKSITPLVDSMVAEDQAESLAQR